MESLDAYIPTDRRHALASGADLAEQTTGAALFADISGFTPLTEALVGALGAQRGAEELTTLLNRIYDALVAEVDDQRGSVIAFSGDAITCWFDQSGDGGWSGVEPRPSPSARAAAAGLAMQRTMEQFATIAIEGVGSVELAVKVAVAAGPVRRFLVGDPSIQTIDVLAGETLQRLAAGEHNAERGEVLLDEAAAAAIAEPHHIVAWREDEETGDRFAVVRAIDAAPPADPWPALDPSTLSEEVTRPWVLPPVATRLLEGLGEFFTELRPAASLFLRFGGIDYDHDPDARVRLDRYIRAVQQTLLRFDAYILQVTVGDKGSYLNVAFGAPIAHEDDAVRAVTAALELRDLASDDVTDVQIGATHGRVRTGAYGGVTRRTYGALGDDVNLAARLMQSALPGEVLVDRTLRRATTDLFVWDEMPPLAVKGKAQPIETMRLVGAKERHSIRLHEPQYALPMVGRREELARITAILDLALDGRGQIVGVSAEAGMGKSRLIAEVVRVANERQVLGYAGECQSYGTHSSYLVWQDVWRGFFHLDPTEPADAQIAVLTEEVVRIDPALRDRVPLLGPVVNLHIPDTDVTASFDPKLRKESLEALLIDCLRARALEVPVLIVLEDCHWIDALSHELLEAVGRAIADLPVMIVVAYRPAQIQRVADLRVVDLVHFTEIQISNLPDDEIEQLVRSKLGQIYGSDAALPADLVAGISQRSQGNPFYIEELLNYLRDHGIDPHEPDALSRIDLPDSLYSLILGRIDQLTEDQRNLLKVASVIGRLFRAAMLWGVYSSFGRADDVRGELDVLTALELTMLDSPEPELVYLFKHVLTQEVAYETLPFAMRAMLHGQIGEYIETVDVDGRDQYLDLLAFHYDRSENTDKRRHYLVAAGNAACAAYANVAAIDYFERALPLLDGHDAAEVLLALGRVQELVGEWGAARAAYGRGLEISGTLSETATAALAQQSLGSLSRKSGEYGEATEWMARARESYETVGDVAGVSHVLTAIGDVNRLQARYEEARAFYDESLTLADSLGDPVARRSARADALKGAGSTAAVQGQLAEARVLFDESLALRRELGDKPGVAMLLNNQGIIARFQGDLEAASERNEESLALFRECGDRWAVGQLLNNEACVAADMRDYPRARSLLRESLAIRRQIGDRAGLALSLNTLADVMLDIGDAAAARPLLDESFAINRELGDNTSLAYLIEDYAGVAAAEDRPDRALFLAGFAAGLREAVGAPLPPGEQARVDRMVAPARDALAQSADEPWERGRTLGLQQDIDGILPLDA